MGGLYMHYKRKKVATLLLTCILSSASSSVVSAHAIQPLQTATTTCPRDSCYGDCGAYNCKIYKVVPVSVYYTLSECKRIVRNYSNFSTVSEFAGYAAGIVNIPAGILLGRFSGSMSTAKAFFQKAVNLNCGIAISYEWVITDITSSSYSRKSTVVYR